MCGNLTRVLSFLVFLVTQRAHGVANHQKGEKPPRKKHAKNPVVAVTAGPPRDGLENLDDFLYVKRSKILVNFMSTASCKLCNALAPEFLKAAEGEHTKSVIFAQGDLSREPSFMQKYGPTTPTLIFFRDSEEAARYRGKYQASSILKWIRKVAGAGVRKLKSGSELEQVLASRPKTEIAVVMKGGADKNDFLASVASHSDWQSVKYAVTINYYFQKGDDDNPVLDLYRGVNEKVSFEAKQASDVSDQTVVNWIREHHLPMFGQITPLTWDSITERATEGLVLVCFTPDHFDAEVSKHAWTFRKAAKKWNKYPFVYLDTREDSNKGRLAELGCDKFPMVVFQRGSYDEVEGTDAFNSDMPIYRRHFEHSQKSLNDKTLNEFMKDALLGKTESRSSIRLTWDDDDDDEEL